MGGRNKYMKTHIREEKKTEPLQLGKGTLFQNKDDEIYKVCDTAEYNETYTDDEIRKSNMGQV